MVLLVILIVVLLLFAAVAAYVLWIMTALARDRAYCWKIQPCDEVAFARERFEELCEDARSRGLHPCGLFLDESRPKSTESYLSFWLNKSRDALVLFVPYRFVGEEDPPKVLFEVLTRLVNDTYLITKSSYVPEITGGGWREMEHLEGEVTLTRLLYRHEQRLRKCGMKPQTIPPEIAVQFSEAYERERIDRLVQLGRAKYLDKSKKRWRYKALGSIRSGWYTMKHAFEDEMQNKGRNAHGA